MKIAGSGLIAASLLLAATAAFANPDMGHKMGSKMGGGMHKGMSGHQAMFMKMDTNKDGAISASEFEAQSNARFKDADTDGDGSISLEEFQKFADVERERRRQEMAKHRFDMLDTNKDGMISAEEYKAGAEKMFNMMDRNRDGKLDKADRGKRHMKNKSDDMHE